MHSILLAKWNVRHNCFHFSHFHANGLICKLYNWLNWAFTSWTLKISNQIICTTELNWKLVLFLGCFHLVWGFINYVPFSKEFRLQKHKSFSLDILSTRRKWIMNDTSTSKNEALAPFIHLWEKGDQIPLVGEDPNRITSNMQKIRLEFY